VSKKQAVFWTNWTEQTLQLACWARATSRLESRLVCAALQLVPVPEVPVVGWVVRIGGRQALPAAGTGPAAAQTVGSPAAGAVASANSTGPQLLMHR
jgi:hypothetical protein